MMFCAKVNINDLDGCYIVFDTKKGSSNWALYLITYKSCTKTAFVYTKNPRY